MGFWYFPKPSSEVSVIYSNFSSNTLFVSQNWIKVINLLYSFQLQNKHRAN